MSTEVLPVPASPPAEAPAITKTARELTAAAFNEPAPTAPTKPSMPPAKAPPVAKAPPAPVKVEAKIEPAKTEPAAVAKVEAKTDTTPEWPGEKLELPSNASPEAKTNFSNMKATMKTEWLKEKNARAEAERQLAVHRTAAPADVAEITAKEARLKAAEDRLAILDLQSHPDFVRQFVEPKNKALALAGEVLQYNGKEGVELASLLGKPLKDFNAAVSEFTKDMNSADAATVAQSLREARTIQTAQQSALANSADLRSQIQAKSAKLQRDAFDAVSTEVTSSLKKIDITEAMAPDEKESAVSYNQRLDTLKSSAEKRAFGHVTEKDVARMAFESEQLALMREHIVPNLERRFASQNQVIADLTSQLEALRGNRSPNPGGGDTNQAPAKQTRAQMIAAAFPGQRV